MTTSESGHRRCRTALAAAPSDVVRKAFGVLVVTFLLALSGERVQAMSSIQCEIRSHPVANGVELTGLIWAVEAVRGDYRFAISSEGAGGTSNIVQSGYFVLQPNEPRVVGSVVVSSGSGSSFSARLSVEVKGETLCSAST